MSVLIAAAHAYHPLLQPGSLFRASVRPSWAESPCTPMYSLQKTSLRIDQLQECQSRFGPARMRGRKAAGQITGTTKMIWDLEGASAHSPLWLTLSLSEPAMVVMRPVTEDGPRRRVPISAQLGKDVESILQNIVDQGRTAEQKWTLQAQKDT